MECVGLEGTLKIIKSQPPCHRQGCQPLDQVKYWIRLHRTPSNLKHLQGWGNHISLGNLFQLLTTFSVKKFRLIFHLDLPSFSLFQAEQA